MSHSRAKEVRAPSGAPIVPRPGTALWLHVWYAVVRGLPAARGCHAELRVQPQPVSTPEPGIVRLGEFQWVNDTRARITVSIDRPHVMLATLIHEVAHFAQNSRHVRRDHGYSWRRALARLCHDLTGSDPAADAAVSRCYDERGRALRPKLRPTRMEALDEAVERTIAEAQPWLRRDGNDLEAWIGAKRFTVPVVIPSIRLRK